jgi:hypothetical protein
MRMDAYLDYYTMVLEIREERAKPNVAAYFREQRESVDCDCRRRVLVLSNHSAVPMIIKSFD